jgi:DNA-binding IclR family transcriptional regulator
MARALLRALSILECFSLETPALALQEIYRTVKLPKSTTFRLVVALQEAGYLLQRGDQRYTLSYKLLLLGSVVRETQEVREITRPLIEGLARSTGETVTLSTRSGDERIVLDVAQSKSTLRSIVLPGDRLPLLYGASGKMFLSELDDKVVERVRQTQQLPKRRVRRKGLFDALAVIREQGYARTQDDRVAGVIALSAPVRDASGEIRYAMTVTGPSSRIEGREQVLSDQLVRVAERVSTLLGHSPSGRPAR